MPEDDRVGSTFGPYRIESLLGHGPHGDVYRALDTGRDRVVALKLLDAERSADPSVRERFLRESKAAAGLGEPHVIPIHDWGEIDGILYLDMRLVDGVDLRTALHGGPLEPERAVALIEQIAAALEVAHGQGLTHRNIKPENILLADNEFCYLVDFGVEYVAPGDLPSTDDPYRAPERSAGRPATPAGDVYSLTAVLHECLTGALPFSPADGPDGGSAPIVRGEVTPVSSVDSAIPEAMNAVIARGLHSDPARRYPAVRTLAQSARKALNAGAGPSAAQMSAAPTESTQAAAPTEAHTVATPTTVVGADSPTQIVGVPPNVGWSNDPTVAVGLGAGQSGPAQYFDAGYPSTDAAYGQYPPPYSNSTPYPTLPSDDRGRGGRGVAAIVVGGILGLALIGLLALGGYWLFAGRDDQQTAKPTPTTPTVTQTITPEETVTGAPPTAAGPPPGSIPCGPSVAAGTTITSCPFAVAVRDEYLRTGPKGAMRVIVAFSPVTATSYPMTCVPENGIIACRGGNDALVYIY